MTTEKTTPAVTETDAQATALKTAPATTKAAKPATKKASKAGVSKKRRAKMEPKSATKTGARPAAGKRQSSNEAHGSTKKAIVLELLRRKQGATTAEIAKATNWQNHSIRAFVNAYVIKKMKLKVESVKNEAGDRYYRITT